MIIQIFKKFHRVNILKMLLISGLVKKGKTLRRELETHGKFRKFPIKLITVKLPPRPEDSRDS